MPGSDDLPPEHDAPGDQASDEDVDFDDLPGMDRDEPEGEDTPDTPEDIYANVDKLIASGEQASGGSEWTDAELNEWYDSIPPGSKAGRESTEEVWAILAALQQAYEGMGISDDEEDLVDVLFGGNPSNWKRLGIDLKTRYRRYVEPRLGDPPPPPPPPAGWVDPEAPELVIMGADGQPIPPAQPAKSSKVPLFIGGGLVLLLMFALFFAWLKSGDDSQDEATPATASSTEPVSSVSPALDDRSTVIGNDRCDRCIVPADRFRPTHITEPR